MVNHAASRRIPSISKHHRIYVIYNLYVVNRGCEVDYAWGIYQCNGGKNNEMIQVIFIPAGLIVKNIILKVIRIKFHFISIITLVI